MASRKPLSYPRYQAWGDNETFLNGGAIEFFDAGTSNNRNIYQDAALTTTAPNPVTLNSRGEPQSAGGTAIDIYLDEQPYKIVLKDSAGVTKHTIDDYVNPESLLVPQDPTDATDQSTDVFEGTLSSDPSSGEVFVVDFQTANTTTTPTFENTSGSLGALTIKTRDGSALWSGALNGVHELQYDGTDLLVLDPESTKGVVEPEHATDSATDTYVSATNTTPPADGVTITRDLQSANTTTTPTLDGKTMTTRDGSALWAGAVSGPNELQYDLGTDTYLVLEPIPTAANVNDAPVKRDSNGRAKFADPSAAQDVVTYGVLGAEYLGTLTASSSATLESTAGWDDSKYAAVMYVLEHILPATDNTTLIYRFSTDGGATFDSGANYADVGLAWSGAAVVGGDSTGETNGTIPFGDGQSNAAGEGLSGTLLVTPVAKSDERTRGISDVSWLTPTNGNAIGTRSSLYTLNGANAIQFSMSSGNIASGRIHIYGMRK